MQKKNQKILHLSIVFGVLIISFFAWDTFVVYPIKLFVVLLHEMSHGLSAVLTGGRIVAIELNQYLGGMTTTEGGSILIIASSGYLGIIALIASVILIVSPRYFSSLVNQIITQSLGLVSVFYVLIDIKEDLLSGAGYQTDANILENITSISATLIALIWLVISAAVIFFLLRKLITSK
jgi:hypothetical protein